MPTPSRISAFLATTGFSDLLNRRGAGMLHHVFQQDLLQAGRFVQEIGFTAGQRRDFFKVAAIDILAQADG